MFKTSGDEGAHMRKACLIEGDKECEDDMIEEIATKKDIKSEVAMDESMADGHVKTFPTPVLETLAVAPVCQRETGETEGRGGKKTAQHDEEVKIEANAYDEDISIVDTCLCEKVNRYEAHEFEEMDKDNGLEVEVAMDQNMKEGDKCIDTSPHYFERLGTW